MMLESISPVLRGSLKKRFLLAALFGLILASAAALLMRPAPSKAQEPQPRDGKRVSLLVEQGFVLPSQRLVSVKNKGGVCINPWDVHCVILAEPVELPERSKTDEPFDVTFTISGNARFKTPQGILAVTSTEGGVIMTPPIVAGPAFGESFVRAVVDGQTVIENLRVVTLETGGIDNLKKYIGTDDPGLIVLGDHYAVLDESKMRVTTQAVTGRTEGPTKKDGKTGGDPQEQSSSQIADQNAVDGVCIRAPWGPGWVDWVWGWSNPWATNGYAYKPESANVVYRADDLADDAVDALYNKYWGCGVAFKVPDSCTVTVYQGEPNTLHYCCNAAMWAIGHRVEWVNPSQHGFPKCPPQ